MNNRKFVKQLEAMKGKIFQYGNSVHYIIDFKMDEDAEKCTVQTNNNSFERPFEAMDEFLEYWQPFNNVPVTLPQQGNMDQVAALMQQEDALSIQLINTLNDNIEKVQNNKDYIPQAQAINNNVNSIVNIVKMRLDLVKQIKSYHPRKL